MRLRGWRLPWRMGLAAVLGAVAAAGLAPAGLWPLTLLVLLTVPALLRSAASARGSLARAPMSPARARIQANQARLKVYRVGA